MSTNIKANVSRMFTDVEPCHVSGSQAELGPAAGQITWRNAMDVAHRARTWLLSDFDEAAEAMREWALSTGAWEPSKVAVWTDNECLALFVQNIASELRMMGSDKCVEIEDLADVYSGTDWDKEPEYPVGHYYIAENSSVLHVDYYTGM